MNIKIKRLLPLFFIFVPWLASAQTPIDEPHLKDLLNHNKALVVRDVRTVEEYVAGHFPGPLVKGDHPL